MAVMELPMAVMNNVGVGGCGGDPHTARRWPRPGSGGIRRQGDERHDEDHGGDRHEAIEGSQARHGGVTPANGICGPALSRHRSTIGLPGGRSLSPS
jgi:hypothetical protein